MSGVFPSFGAGVNALITGDTAIWVDVNRTDDYTANGSVLNPYLTIAAGLAAMTSSRNQLLIMPGTYTITAALSLPAYSCSIQAVGGIDTVEINAAVSVTPLISIIPGASLAATGSYYLQDLYINNSESSQVGIQIDNLAATYKILLNIRNCEISDGGTAIDVDHAAASDAVRIYINNGGMEIEGAIVFDVGNASDRLYIKDAILGSEIDSTGDNVAFMLKLMQCEVPQGGAATNGSTTAQLGIAIGCWSVTGVTYAAFATGQFGSSKFTETIIG